MNLKLNNPIMKNKFILDQLNTQDENTINLLTQIISKSKKLLDNHYNTQDLDQYLILCQNYINYQNIIKSNIIQSLQTKSFSSFIQEIFHNKIEYINSSIEYIQYLSQLNIYNSTINSIPHISSEILNNLLCNIQKLEKKITKH
ncbi:MAG: hypothetical protein WC934_06335 [Acidithiobacillus sp.]|jgi:hypothetical protein|uniref:hypothetical protein n=1 Tax=Acidithiobacillus sp. TaxID=1872118 RepID=UPI00355E5E60